MISLNSIDSKRNGNFVDCAKFPVHFLVICDYAIYVYVIKTVLSEPVGSVAPKISGGRLQEVEVQTNNSLSILCMGQSFPRPLFT